MVTCVVHVLGVVSRERGDHGRFVETVTLDDVLAVLREANEPLTATEVGDQLGLSIRAALDELAELHERGAIERKQVGARPVVWWLAEADAATAEFDPDDPLFTGDALLSRGAGNSSVVIPRPRNQEEPMTDDELEEFRDAMEEQGEELREALAEDLGGEPDDYRKRPVADGGE